MEDRILHLLVCFLHLLVKLRVKHLKSWHCIALAFFVSSQLAIAANRKVDRTTITSLAARTLLTHAFSRLLAEAGLIVLTHTKVTLR